MPPDGVVALDGWRPTCSPHPVPGEALRVTVGARRTARHGRTRPRPAGAAGRLPDTTAGVTLSRMAAKSTSGTRRPGAGSPAAVDARPVAGTSGTRLRSASSSLAAAVVAMALGTAALGIGGCRIGAVGTSDTPDAERATNGAAAPTGPVVIALRSDPDGLDPIRAAGPLARNTARLLWQGLVVPDARTGRPVAGLADHWDWSADGTALTVTLRAARWSDGRPVTGRDAAASLEGALRAAPPASAPNHVIWATALDDDRLLVGLASRDCRAMTDLTVGVLPEAVALRAAGPADAAGFDPATATTGDYRLAAWQPDRELRLEPTVGRGATVPVPPIVFRVEPGASGALAAVFGGRADMAPVDAKDAVHVRSRIEAGAPARLVRVAGSDLVLVLLNLADPDEPQTGWLDRDGDLARDEDEPWRRQLPHPVLGDVEVRQALASAIDYRRLIDRVAYGEAARLPADVPPAAAWAFASGLAPTRTDPTAARLRLEAAGWLDRDGDGTLERDGVPLRLDLLVSQGNTAHEIAAEELKLAMARAGVEVRQKRVDYGELIGDVLGQRFDMALVTWHDQPPGADPGDRWSRQGDRPGLGPNCASLADTELERLLAETRAVPGCDADAMARGYQAVQARVQALAPILPLYSPHALYVLGPRLAGWQPGPWSVYQVPAISAVGRATAD